MPTIPEPKFHNSQNVTTHSKDYLTSIGSGRLASVPIQLLPTPGWRQPLRKDTSLPNARCENHLSERPGARVWDAPNRNRAQRPGLACAVGAAVGFCRLAPRARRLARGPAACLRPQHRPTRPGFSYESAGADIGLRRLPPRARATPPPRLAGAKRARGARKRPRLGRDELNPRAPACGRVGGGQSTPSPSTTQRYLEAIDSI